MLPLLTNTVEGARVISSSFSVININYSITLANFRAIQVRHSLLFLAEDK